MRITNRRDAGPRDCCGVHYACVGYLLKMAKISSVRKEIFWLSLRVSLTITAGKPWWSSQQGEYLVKALHIMSGHESHSQIGEGLGYKCQKPTLSDPLLLTRPNVLKCLHAPQTGDISHSDCNSRTIEHIRVCRDVFWKGAFPLELRSMTLHLHWL